MPNNMYIPPLPIIPFLPFVIKKEVITNNINATAKISENHVQILFGL